MKIRNGFVSNSSSSSFIINSELHPEITPEFIKDSIKKIIIANKQFLGELDESLVDNIDINVDDKYIKFTDHFTNAIPSSLYSLIEVVLPGYWD